MRGAGLRRRATSPGLCTRRLGVGRIAVICEAEARENVHRLQLLEQQLATVRNAQYGLKREARGQRVSDEATQTGRMEKRAGAALCCFAALCCSYHFLQFLAEVAIIIVSNESTVLTNLNGE